MTRPTSARLDEWEVRLPETSRGHLNQAVDQIVAAKERGGTVVAVTGSGPNIHEGVTTLIAELIRTGIIDAVLTSSAVVAHEMAGTLDRVKRVRAADHPELGLPPGLLPRGGVFEITEMTSATRVALQAEFDGRWEIYDRIAALPGDVLSRLPAIWRGRWDRARSDWPAKWSRSPKRLVSLSNESPVWAPTLTR